MPMCIGADLRCWPGLLLLGALIRGHLLHDKDGIAQACSSIFGGGALFVTTTLFFFINRIEGYSQRAAIDFFEARQGRTAT